MNRVYLAGVVSCARRAPLKSQRHFAFPQKRNRSTFAQFFQLRDKICARQISVVLPKFLPVAVEKDQGGEAVHVILARELQVLLFQFGSLSLPPRTTRPREVELQEHQVFAGVIFEIRLRENVLVQSNAPAAPVGTSKIKEQ